MRSLTLLLVLGCGSSSPEGSNAPTPVPASPEDDRAAKLFGKTRATLGTAFDGISLGGTVRGGDAKRIATQIGGVEIELEPGPRGLRAIEIKQTGNCAALRAQLDRAWRPPTHLAWHDSATHVRASFVVNTDDDTCWLRFDRYLEPDAWLAALPVDLLGADPKKLLERLGADALVDEDVIKWIVPGIGFATEETTIEARIVDGKIYKLSASSQTDAATTVALSKLLAKRAAGEPTVAVDDKTTKRTWTSKPRLALWSTADFVRAGTDFFTLFVDP